MVWWRVRREHGVVESEEGTWCGGGVGGDVVWWGVGREHGEGTWCGVVETCSGCSYTIFSTPGYGSMKIQSGFKLCPCLSAIKFTL